MMYSVSDIIVLIIIYPELRFKIFQMKRPRATLLCLSVCLSPAVSGVRGADEQQKNKFGTTYSLQSKLALCDRTVEFFYMKIFKKNS